MKQYVDVEAESVVISNYRGATSASSRLAKNTRYDGRKEQVDLDDNDDDTDDRQENKYDVVRFSFLRRRHEIPPAPAESILNDILSRSGFEPLSHG